MFWKYCEAPRCRWGFLVCINTRAQQSANQQFSVLGVMHAEQNSSWRKFNELLANGFFLFLIQIKNNARFMPDEFLYAWVLNIVTVHSLQFFFITVFYTLIFYQSLAVNPNEGPKNVCAFCQLWKSSIELNINLNCKFKLCTAEYYNSYWNIREIGGVQINVTIIIINK